VDEQQPYLLPQESAIDRSLLDAKLSVPQSRPGVVSRRELIARARTSPCPLVSMTAPAGYGKSTLLAEWADLEDRPVACVALDRFDDDPAALTVLLASAFSRVSPGNDELIADVSGIGVSVLGRAAPRLAAAVRTALEPFVIMLDDLHELRSPACHDVLEVLIAGIPPGSQLIAASRVEQPHVARLRTTGDAFEIGPHHLALDASGVVQIFADSDVAVSGDMAIALADRTEGWPVGLYLAALIARQGGGDALTISGDDRYVADYLYHEAFTLLPEHDQQFLRRTATLDQFCAPLCEAVLDESGVQDRLRQLEAAGLFLIPLDRRREWYRYHSLFREFLLAELRRVEPEVLPLLHGRAADWYEASGSPALAVEHLIDTAERDRCVQLVASLVLPTYQLGQISTVQRWLSSLDDEAICDYPPLAVLAGWISIFTGHPVETQRWASIVDAASFERVPSDGSASFESARAMLRAAMCASGPERMLADGQYATEQEPTWSPWRDTALCMLGEAWLLTGDHEKAVAAFTEASELAAEMGNNDSLVDSRAELAVLAMDDGHWVEAAEHNQIALKVVEQFRMFDYPTSGLAFAGAARLALHRGDLAEVNRQLTQAMRCRPMLTYVLPWLAVRMRLQLGYTYLSIGDPGTVRHLLHEVDDIIVHRPALGTLIDDVKALRDKLDAASTTAAIGVSPLTAAELRLLPYLQTHLSMREIAERLFVSRNTVNSQVSAVYRKLGVTSRTDAVNAATTAGLLGG
jgi:LuxR family transcriptional regulator, maltose regulon positive regulatory protein